MSTLTEIANRLIEETNCSTSEAIKALDESGGDYEKALEILKAQKFQTDFKRQMDEDKGAGEREENRDKFTINGKDMLKVIKQLIKEGNVTRITVKRNEEIIVNIPVNAAAVGVVLAPYLAIIGTMVALAVDCTLEVEREGNVMVNVNEKIKSAEEKVEKTINDILDM